MGKVAHIQWTAKGHATFESYFTTWDAEYYIYLSEQGYQPGHKACAFYPLWPLLIRLAARLTAGDPIIAGILLANIFSIAGFWLFFQIVSWRFSHLVARNSLALLLAFPGSLFYQFIYSESLFFLLLMLLCLSLERDLLWLGLVAAFLLPLTRAVGILSVFPISLHLVTRGSKDYLNLNKRTGLPQFVPEPPKSDISGTPSTGTTKRLSCLLLAAPICGWVVYFGLMWVWTGDPIEGFRAQQYWHVQSTGNLFDIPKFAVALFTPTTWHAFIGSFLDRTMFVLLLWCLPLIWRLDKVWFTWALVLGIVPAMTGTFTSFTRFASVVFPMYMVLGERISQPGRGFLRATVLALFTSLHLVLLLRFTYFLWAG